MAIDHKEYRHRSLDSDIDYNTSITMQRSALRLTEPSTEAVQTRNHYRSQALLSLPLCLFSLPSCSRKATLFVPVLTRRALGVSFGVHYIAFWQGTALRDLFARALSSPNRVLLFCTCSVCAQDGACQV